jgi:hypothetical protein
MAFCLSRFRFFRFLQSFAETDAAPTWGRRGISGQKTAGYNRQAGIHTKFGN